MTRKKKTGRPSQMRTPVNLSCTVELVQWNWVNARAKAKNVSVSEVIRALLQKRVDAKKRSAA